MHYVVHQISVLLKIIGFLKPFLRSIVAFYHFSKKIINFSSQHEKLMKTMIKSSRLGGVENIEQNVIKDIRNIFRLKKENKLST